MATAGHQREVVVEATRAAAVAVHAATGLARQHAQALRLLRAAEGLCRIAIVVMLASDGVTKTEEVINNGKDQRDISKGKGDVSIVGAAARPNLGSRRRLSRRRRV